jgi:hypothetical protein
MSDPRCGLRLEIGFTDHFSPQLVITLNYSAIANFRTLQFTRVFSSNGFQQLLFLCFRAQVLSERRLPSKCLFLLQLSFARTELETPFPTELLHAYPLPRERV